MLCEVSWNELDALCGKAKGVSMDTLIATANTRDMVLSHIDELEETYDALLALFRRLDMLDDKAFITTAMARIMQLSNQGSVKFLEMMEEA